MSYVRKNISTMQGYQPGFQPDEPGFIKLNTNENPYPPSPQAIAAMQHACQNGIRKYPDPLGQPFRIKAAEILGLRPESIICGFGSDDILTICVRTFCNAGDTIAFPYPTYSLYETLAKIQNTDVVTTHFPEDYSLPGNLAGLGAELTFLTNPNAPSGTLIPPQDIKQLATELDGILVVDEAYVDFAELSCLHLIESCDNIVITRTMSKSYSLAGLRFGFAAANEDLITGMLKVKDSYNVSAPAVAGATAALDDQDYVKKNINAIVNTRTRLIEELKGLDFHCWPSQTNFVLCRAPEGRKADDIFQKLFDEKILVRYFDMPRLDDCLRITVGTDKEIECLLNALQEIL